MTKALSRAEQGAVRLYLRPVIELTDEQFFEFCQLNRDVRIERTAAGDLVIMPPTGGGTGHRSILLGMWLTQWALQDGTGVTFDSSTGFTLPNGATRSPDVAWVKRSRLAGLTPEQRERFLPLCPDFVGEFRSPSDRVSSLQEKMQEYIDNGAQLGWLIDAHSRVVYVYRPSHSVERLEQPATLAGDPVLPRFTLDLRTIWEPGF